jgi:sugar phosphate isomerase/epimerase
MIISGIADEASPELEGQIHAHRKLGWDTLELRLIGKTNICQIDEAGFDQARRTLEEAGMGVVCFASPIANWSRPITSDFAVDVQDLRRCLPRLQRLGTRFIRVMSYPNDGLEERAWRVEAIRRMKQLARIAADGGVILLHENCSGWGGISPENQRILLEEVASPALQIVFDTGNPVAEGHPPEETWDFYRTAKPYIRHIHIKDCRRLADGAVEYTMPGEGASLVREILAEALAGGYDGAFSIEPHISAQIHLGTSASGAAAEEVYLEYGRRAQALLAELCRSAPG